MDWEKTFIILLVHMRLFRQKVNVPINKKQKLDPKIVDCFFEICSP
jgi:hypothetical protein